MVPLEVQDEDLTKFFYIFPGYTRLKETFIRLRINYNGLFKVFLSDLCCLPYNPYEILYYKHIYSAHHIFHLLATL